MSMGSEPQKHRQLEDPFDNYEHRTIQQYLVDHGVNQRSARHVTVKEFKHWSIKAISGVFAKVGYYEPSMGSLEDDSTTEVGSWTKPSPRMLEQSAREGIALCINKDGEFDLRKEGYYCISHVWEEGIRADTDQNRGVSTRLIRRIFERISHNQVEWIWLDGLAIPGGNRSLSFREEEQKTALINSMADIYKRCEAVIVFDALTMRLKSADPVETAIILSCGKWMTRVWTWQEIKLADKALVLTATSAVNFAEMLEALRVRAGASFDYGRGDVGSLADKEFYDLFMGIGRLKRLDDRGISLADICMASVARTTGNDIDYARAYFPALGLSWRAGMSREEGMMKIYEARTEQATRLILMHGSPRTTLFPGWAPSYLTGLTGPLVGSCLRENRGIRREWFTVKVNRRIETEKPRGLFLALESYDDEPALCGCLIGKEESQATMRGMDKAIDAGKAFLLSKEQLYPVTEWAKNAILIERVELDHDDEAYVHLTVEVTVIQKRAVSWETKWLIRHENPNSEEIISGKFVSQLRLTLNHDRTHGQHDLINAAYDGNQDAVERLLSHPTEISDRDEKGWTALHAACASANLNIVRILLQEPLRFDVNAGDFNGRSSLVLAVETGEDDIVDLLIDSGANPNHWDPNSLSSPVEQAIKRDHSSTLHLLLLKGANPNKPGPLGFTPFFWACNKPNMLQILLSNGADPFTVTMQGITALHFAAKAGSSGSISQLLDKGMDPNMPVAESHDNPLSMAIEEKVENEDAVKLLLYRGADPNVVYKNGWTPLMLACKMGHVNICQALVNAGARTEGNERCSPEGWTALHIAAMGGHRAICKLLIESGTDLDAKDNTGSTALALALGDGKESVVHALRSAADAKVKVDAS